LERHLERIVEQGDVWLASMQEVAEHAKAQKSNLRQEVLDIG
jgi:hypothetical protein